MHQHTLADRGTGLHLRHTAGLAGKPKVRHARGYCSRAHNQVLVAGEVELVHERPHTVGIDASTRGDQAGSDFDDKAHSLLI